MKKVIFKKISILSKRSKKGFIYEFSPGINIVFGKNDTGKSSLIKSLYYTLGGDMRLDKDWKNDDIITKLCLAVEEKEFVFIRENKRISIFSIAENVSVLVSSSSMKDIAEKVKTIFNFNLKLTLKKTGDQTQANPACLYLPFYIDQDDGWQNILSSFSGMGMYNDWQKNTLQFHSGIKPKEFYELLGKIRKIEIKLEELQSVLDVILIAKDKIDESFGYVFFDIDIDLYQSRLNKFLGKCQELYEKETDYRVQLVDLLSDRDSISSEIENCKRSLDSFNDEFPIEIEKKYYEIEGKEKILELIPKMYEEKENINKKINLIKEQLRSANEISCELKRMIKEVKGKLTLNDIIKSQANKSIDETFEKEINEISGEITFRKKDLESLKEEQNRFFDKKRSQEINDYFKNLLAISQNQLDIGSPVIGTIIQYSKITKSKTGSRGPRAIFAYHYSLLKTMGRYSTSSMLPIVIDSPKQQDLDTISIEKVIDLCTKDLSGINQIIVGAVSLEDNMHGFHQLELKNKYSLLCESEYDKAYIDIMPLYEKGLTNYAST